MKRFIYIITFAVAVLFGTGCTKYNFDDTGVANGNHNTTMWDYFATNSYDWDSLRVMAQRADLVSLFQGTSTYGTDITFFGPTNNSIRAYLYNNNMNSIAEIPVDDCKAFILNGVLTKRILLDEFKAGRPSTDPSTPIGTGGEHFEAASGKQLWIYTFRESYNGVPGAGPVQLYLVSPATTKQSHVASSNIQTLTGVVHSLDYNFRLTDL